MTQDWKGLYQKKAEGHEDQGQPLEYTDAVIDHFSNPRNVGRIENWDGMGLFGDPSCGDSLEVTLRLEGERIAEIGFLIYGCAGAIATSSMVTELAKGKTTSEASRINDEDVVLALGGLPESKQHCSLLGVQALRLALLDTLVMKQCLEQNLVKDADEYRQKRQDGKLKYDPRDILKGKVSQ